jgi:2-phospho-L-lactate guanylyltransferase
VRTAAILPVKRFAVAKQRLGASVTHSLRARLAAAMVADVLDALAAARTIERIVVVTREHALAAQAQKQGAIVLEDPTEQGQSAAVALGIERALREGLERVLCVPGDCPALDPGEVDALLGAANSRPEQGAAPEVVIVPDRHGTGTNGLLLSPAGAIRPSFGPGSFERHRALARAAGAAWRVERPPSLLLDIDTGADLAALRARLADTGARAERTRALLGHNERPPILSLSSSG